MSRPRAATAPQLLEREGEIELLGDRLDRATQGEGALVLVEGAAGVGKSALLARLRADARDRGVRELQAIGGELERDYPFGLARQLFEATLLSASEAERDRLLAGAAARAAPVVGLEAPDGSRGESSADASFATLHGLYWLVAALAESDPLLLVVDDAHWADAASLRFLDFLARRVPELAVLVVVGLRPREPGAEHELIDRLRDAPDVAIVQPTELSADGVRKLVDEGLGDTTADSVADGAAEATGGNPLLVLELIRALSERDAPPTPEAVREALPANVTRSVERRLNRLSHDAGAVARAVAVLGDRRSAEVVAAATGIDLDRVGQALYELRDADFLVLDPLRFVHPLIGQAVAERVGGPDRDALHHAAARALHGTPGTEEEVIVHLLASRPLCEDWTAPLLRDSARRAMEEGAPDAAVRRLRRALEESPAGDDELALDLARAAASAGDPSAPEYVAAAAGSDDLAVAAQATELELTIGAFDPEAGLPGMAARLRESIDRLGAESDPDLHDRLLGQLLNIMFVDSRLAGERAEVLLGSTGDAGPGALSHRAWDAAAGEATAADVRALAADSLGERPFIEPAVLEQPTPIWATLGLLVADGPEAADAAIADAEATVRRYSTPLGRSFAAYMRAEWQLVHGSVASAESTAREALDLFVAAGNDQSEVSARAVLASALVLRGSLDEADAVLTEVPADEYFDVAWGGGLVWTSRAELRLAQGRPREAAADLRRLAAFVERYGWQRFPRGAPAALLARALALGGEADEGRALAEAEAAEQRRRGAVRLEAEALMALGSVLPGEEGLEALTAATEVAERSTSLLLRGRAAFELGSALRRAGQRSDARERLGQARELGHKVDATGLVDRATEELTVAGGRPRRIAASGVDALTASERRVAEHAARGLTNREIAETLFVTRKTVEFQLGKAYGKLGIRSRAQLAGALSGETEAASA